MLGKLKNFHDEGHEEKAKVKTSCSSCLRGVMSFARRFLFFIPEVH